MNSVLKLTILGAAVALLSVTALRAQSQTFTIDINTLGLSADTFSPYDLDFQLNYGNSALATNTATLSNFSFTGGSATGSATIASGSASGNLTSSVVLSTTSLSSSELYQAFTPGVTNISFNATISETGPDIGTPSQFSVAILDQELGFPAEITTNSPDTLSLVDLDLDASNTFADIDTYSGIASSNGDITLSNVSASAVPEPATTATLIGAAGLLVAFGVRRFRKRSNLAA